VGLPFGVLLALVTFLLWNTFASLLVALLARALARHADERRPRARARLLLLLRLLPLAVSGAFVLGLFAPAYLLLEPEASGEQAGLRLATLALGSVLLLALALWRSVASWRSTTRLTGSWLRGAEPLPVNGLAADAYSITDAFPIVSVVGSVHPRVFVARQVLSALSPEELAVALEHEAAHVAAKDNLKRLVFACAPDVLGLLPASRFMRREWERAAEVRADAVAVRGDRRRALDLSSALVKVARLAPAASRVAWPARALHDGQDIGDRVRLLLAPDPAQEPEGLTTRGRRLLACGAGAALVALALVATQLPVLSAVHELTETLVRLLG
jgi:Zn-dependent protease with chaperone function